VTDQDQVDMVNHPPHYRRGPEVTCPHCSKSYVLECIQVTRAMGFSLGNAVKYIWRVAFGGKADDIEDLGKAIWYVTDERKHRKT